MWLKQCHKLHPPVFTINSDKSYDCFNHIIPEEQVVNNNSPTPTPTAILGLLRHKMRNAILLIQRKTITSSQNHVEINDGI